MGSLWNRSGTIERYADDLRAAGAKAYFFQGGTTTPLVVYRDAGESSAFTHPLVADANGRWPDIFVPYTVSYDVRVTSADNVQLTFSEQIPNPDPVELSVTIDPLEKVSTGMIHAELINGTKAGYVRLNGRTIGNASSSATERINDDTLNLFTYLWNNLPNTIAAVSGGRGASAASDFTANKTIVLPNFQGSVPVGLDDMGAAAGGFFSGLTFLLGNATTPGSTVGVNTGTLTAANMPAHSHSGTTQTEGAHTHTGTTGNQSADHTHSGTTGAGTAHTHAHTLSAVSDGAHTHFMMSNVGSNAAISPTNQMSSGATYGSSLDYLIGGQTAGATHGLTGTGGAHTHSLTGAITNEGAHTHTITTGVQSTNHNHTFTTGAGSLHSHTFTTDTQGSGTPFPNLGRSVLVTWFIKL